MGPGDSGGAQIWGQRVMASGTENVFHLVLWVPPLYTLREPYLN